MSESTSPTYPGPTPPRTPPPEQQVEQKTSEGSRQLSISLVPRAALPHLTPEDKNLHKMLDKAASSFPWFFTPKSTSFSFTKKLDIPLDKHCTDLPPSLLSYVKQGQPWQKALVVLMLHEKQADTLNLFQEKKSYDAFTSALLQFRIGPTKETALHRAVRHRAPAEAISEMMNQGANVNARDTNDHAPFFYAQDVKLSQPDKAVLLSPYTQLDTRICCMMDVDEANKSLNGTLSKPLQNRLFKALMSNEQARIAFESLLKQSQKNRSQLIQETLDTLKRSTPDSPLDSLEGSLLNSWRATCGLGVDAAEALATAQKLAENPEDRFLKQWATTAAFWQQQNDCLQCMSLEGFNEGDCYQDVVFNIMARKFFINEQFIEDGIDCINRITAGNTPIGSPMRACPNWNYTTNPKIGINIEPDPFHSTETSLVFNLGESTGTMISVTLPMPEEIQRLSHNERWKTLKRIAETASSPLDSKLSPEIKKWKADTLDTLLQALEGVQASYPNVPLPLENFLQQIRHTDQTHLYLRADQNLSLSPSTLLINPTPLTQEEQCFATWQNLYPQEPDPTCISHACLQNATAQFAQEFEAHDGPAHITEEIENFSTGHGNSVECYKWTSTDEKGEKLLVTYLMKQHEPFRETWIQRHLLLTRLALLIRTLPSDSS